MIGSNRYLMWSPSSDDDSGDSNYDSEFGILRSSNKTKGKTSKDPLEMKSNEDNGLCAVRMKCESKIMEEMLIGINDPRIINLSYISTPELKNCGSKSEANDKGIHEKNTDEKKDSFTIRNFSAQLHPIQIVHYLCNRRDSITTLTSCSLETSCDDSVDSYSTISDDESIYEFLNVPKESVGEEANDGNLSNEKLKTTESKGNDSIASISQNAATEYAWNERSELIRHPIVNVSRSFNFIELSDPKRKSEFELKRSPLSMNKQIIG